VVGRIIALDKLGAFDEQTLANTVWSYTTAGISHPALFEKDALDNLQPFDSQDFSSTLLAYAKAGVSHPALFEKVADHIVALDELGAFDEQALANVVW
jgi:hypothetical protein